MIPSRGQHARRPGWGVAIGAGVLALLLILAVLVYAGSRRSPRGEVARVPGVQEPAPTLASPPALENWPRWGVTHTQYSADNEPAEVEDQARGLLRREPMLQNQHIMGWGADNPEPAPGRYNLRDLNSRLTFISSAGGIPVITLCCAPDWMKGGTAGRTDWEKNATVAPLREHFDDFAKLSVRIAKQYPTVKHFLVWNEFKGFWDPSADKWDAAGYTEMYNKVYTALKKHDPAIQVGGPYISLGSTGKQVPGAVLSGPWGSVEPRGMEALEHWLARKKGADFVVVDGWSTAIEGGAVPDEFTAVTKFGAITTWLRQRSGGLPVWWAEWYVEPENSGWDETRRTAVQAAAMMEFASSGAATALYWNPQRKQGQECPGCLWEPGTGAELPMAGLLSGFTKWFPAGIELERVEASDPQVKVLAQQRMLVMVNTTARELSATVDGEQVTLKPYEIRWSPRV
ncbi:xylan 1,4-beta-xylosidase [Nonomuraea sp. NPDC050310]|uniref:xylan 1,4-beta-xylosidase n=1 Tax=Nonomuraea sp. NPDC050310 TaxID=3154935 RepID=UPI0033F36111